MDLCMGSGHSLWKPLRIPNKLQEGLTMENGPISVEGFHRKFSQELSCKISMETQPRIKRHFQKAREASDVDSLHKAH
eukprot:359830-Chlamydomonas_euryale.AAC.2